MLLRRPAAARPLTSLAAVVPRSHTAEALKMTPRRSPEATVARALWWNDRTDDGELHFWKTRASLGDVRVANFPVIFAQGSWAAADKCRG